MVGCCGCFVICMCVRVLCFLYESVLSRTNRDSLRVVVVVLGVRDLGDGWLLWLFCDVCPCVCVYVCVFNMNPCSGC